MSEFSDAQKEYLDELFSKLSTSINQKYTEVAKQISEIKNEISESSKAYEDKIEKLTVRNNHLENEVRFLQKKVRKNNIVIYGINSDLGNEKLCESVISILNRLLEINLDELDINDVYKLGKNKSRQPILVEFTTYWKKKLILRNVKKLKGKNIFIAEDQSWEDRENTKILVKHLNKCRAKGNKAIIRGNRLIVDNQTYLAEDLKNNDIETEEEEEEEEEENDVYNIACTSVSRENLPVSENLRSIKEQPQKNKPEGIKPSKSKTKFKQKKNLRSTAVSSKK